MVVLVVVIASCGVFWSGEESAGESTKAEAEDDVVEVAEGRELELEFVAVVGNVVVSSRRCCCCCCDNDDDDDGGSPPPPEAESDTVAWPNAPIPTPLNDGGCDGNAGDFL